MRGPGPSPSRRAANYIRSSRPRTCRETARPGAGSPEPRLLADELAEYAAAAVFRQAVLRDLSISIPRERNVHLGTVCEALSPNATLSRRTTV